jgi:hypothetical protein
MTTLISTDLGSLVNSPISETVLDGHVGCVPPVATTAQGLPVFRPWCHSSMEMNNLSGGSSLVEIRNDAAAPLELLRADTPTARDIAGGSRST